LFVVVVFQLRLGCSIWYSTHAWLDSLPSCW